MKITALYLLSALYMPICLAQNLNTAAGYIPGRPYVTEGVDTIDMASGGVSINIPIRSFKQQDPVSINYSLVYSSKHLAVGTTEPDSGGSSLWLWTDSNVFDSGVFLNLTETPQFSGVSLSLNQDYRTTNVRDFGSDNGEDVIVGSDGGRHSIGVDPVYDLYRTIDTSGYQLSTAYGQPAVIDRDGVVHTAWYENSVLSSTGNPIPLYQNRGFTPASLHFDSSDHKPNAIWDTKGLILPWADPNTGHVGVSVPNTNCPNSAGVTTAYRLDMPAPVGTTSTYYLCYSTIHVLSNFPASVTPQGFTVFQADQDLQMLTAVVLPNSSAWQFEYADRDEGDDPTINYGTLTKLIFPTGGYITYSYATIQPCPVVEQDGTSASRFIKSRMEHVDANAQPAVWSYSYSPGTITSQFTSPEGGGVSNNYTDAVMTVTKPDQSQEIHSIRVSDDTCGGYEDGVKTVDPSGNTLQQVTKGYAITGGFIGTPTRSWVGEKNYAPAYTLTTLDDGSSWAQYNDYDVRWLPSSGWLSYGNLIRSCVLNFGVTGTFDATTGSMCTSGPVLSRTETSYEYQTDAGARSANLPDLIKQQTTYDSNGNIASATRHLYDGDGVNAPFGSLVETDQWLNTTSPASWIPQYTPHDSHGATTSITDALGHTTTVAYDSTGVYKQTTTSPTTNGVQHVSTTIYDPNSDLPASSYDQNGGNTGSQSTTFHYDGLLRLTSVTLPVADAGTGGATISYDDANRIVTASVLQGPGALITASQQFDGFGRPVTSTTTDPAGNILTDTTYDLMGRIVAVSNPYRSLTDSTYGLTCTDYDYLGRTTRVRKVGGGSCAVTTGILSLTRQVPFGPVTDIYDGDSHHSKQQTNAAGKLIKVWEPDASNVPSLETDYTYDALGNLTQVHQIGKTGDTPVDRRFDYDSLSRLVATLNPETGSVSSTCSGAQGPWSLCYSYDDVGNVVSKIDARLLKTSFSYDVLNRLLSKTYANANGTADSANTPITCFSYDVPISGGSNFNGLISAEWTQHGSSCGNPVPSQALSSRKILGYDRLGRVTAEQRCILATCKSSGTYTYDLAGNLTQFGNGSSATILHTFDGTNRLSSVSLLDSIYPYLSTPVYTVKSFGPAGPSVIDIGSTMRNVRTYDPALRVTGDATVIKP